MIAIDVKAQASGRAEFRMAHSSRLFLSAILWDRDGEVAAGGCDPPSRKKHAEAHARPGHERVAADAMVFDPLADAPCASFSYSQCQTAQFLLSRLVCVRVLLP